ncbi:hypothetical protein AB0J14_38515 [Micromonospora arborensis]|uniref:hypothetical protein n=1 Tax=Micromonospora arborensis TaxID=2116518 RepID=UPI00340F5AFD
MSHYEKGVRFERKTRTDLAENGYEVIRAAGSKGSTKIDLLAMKPGQQLLIQCKESGDISPAEWNRIVEVAGWYPGVAIPLLAANGPRGRGVVYTQLLGVKVPRARTQPCRPFLLDEIAAACQTCGPTATELHPRLAGVARCSNCKAHAEPAPLVVPYQAVHPAGTHTINLPAQEAS